MNKWWILSENKPEDIEHNFKNNTRHKLKQKKGSTENVAMAIVGWRKSGLIFKQMNNWDTDPFLHPFKLYFPHF